MVVIMRISCLYSSAEKTITYDCYSKLHSMKRNERPIAWSLVFLLNASYYV